MTDIAIFTFIFGSFHANLGGVYFPNRQNSSIVPKTLNMARRSSDGGCNSIFNPKPVESGGFEIVSSDVNSNVAVEEGGFHDHARIKA